MMRSDVDRRRPEMMHRWLMRWGGLILVAVVAVAAWLLPVLLPPSPLPVKLPPTSGPVQAVPPAAPQDSPPTAAPAGPASPADESLTSTQKPDALRRPPPVPATSLPAEPGQAGPVVDLRRVHRQAAVPTGQPRPHPIKHTPAEDFDRSAAARARGVQRFGGTAGTESAVEAGLAWLAAHQSPHGTWDRFNFADLDPPGDRCTGHALRRTTHSLEAGLTGLCLLAFLGAGYTDRSGPYREVVRQAVDALLERQQAHGGFCPEDGMAGYNDSLATFGLAEYYAMTREARVAEPLQRAVGRLVRSQQALGGWDYYPWPTSGRNDTSITAWVVQALHACAAAGIEVPRRTLVKAALHFSRATEQAGHVRYSDGGTGFELDATHRPRYRYGPAMTAAGLTCEQLLGWRMNGLIPHKQATILFSQPPSATKFRGRDRTQLHSEYYWYYGTVAMLQRGGKDWRRWNARLRDAILPLQNREKTAGGKKRAAYGSWDPYGEHWGKWGQMGSRVYTTAICVLTLEIYYRHTPAYLTQGVLLTVEAWRAHLAEASARERREAVACLAQLRVEMAEAILVEVLHDVNSSVALAAAEALAWIDSPMGLALLEEVVATLPPWGRRSSELALRRARELAQLAPVEGQVRLFDARRRLATLDLPRAYVGMGVTIRREQREVARMRVVQRFTGRVLAVAELSGAVGAIQPRCGDVAVGR